jgi:hypothetical protein
MLPATRPPVRTDPETLLTLALIALLTAGVVALALLVPVHPIVLGWP